MRRYWFGKTVNDVETIDGEVFHHIVKVCRHQVGDKLELLDGTGTAVCVEISTLNKSSLVATVKDSRLLPVPSEPKIRLALSFPKFATFEAVLQKSVELGVSSIQPFFSEFSFVTQPPKISESRWTRFEKIVVAATEQSGRGDLLQLHSPIPYQELVKQIEPDRDIMAFEFCDQALTMRTTDRPYDRCTLVVGSEGGFSQKEADAFPGKVVSLGPLILRCETACTSFVSRFRQMSLD